MADPNGHRRLPTGDPDQAYASPSRPVSAVDGVPGGEDEATYSYFPPGAYEPTAVAYSIRDAANDDERARQDQGGGAHDHHHDRLRQDQRGEAHLHDRPGEKSKVPVGPSALSSSTSADQQGNDTADTDMTPLTAPAKSSYDVNFPPLLLPTPAPAPAVAHACASSSSSSTAVAGAMGSSSAPVPDAEATRIDSHKTVLCMKWREGRCHNGGACRYLTARRTNELCRR